MANAGPNTNGSFFIVQKKDLSDAEINFQQRGYPKEIIELYKDHGGTPQLDFAHSFWTCLRRHGCCG